MSSSAENKIPTGAGSKECTTAPIHPYRIQARSNAFDRPSLPSGYAPQVPQGNIHSRGGRGRGGHFSYSSRGRGFTSAPRPGPSMPVYASTPPQYVMPVPVPVQAQHNWGHQGGMPASGSNYVGTNQNRNHVARQTTLGSSLDNTCLFNVAGNCGVATPIGPNRSQPRFPAKAQLLYCPVMSDGVLCPLCTSLLYALHVLTGSSKAAEVCSAELDLEMAIASGAMPTAAHMHLPLGTADSTNLRVDDDISAIPWPDVVHPFFDHLRAISGTMTRYLASSPDMRVVARAAAVPTLRTHISQLMTLLSSHPQGTHFYIPISDAVVSATLAGTPGQTTGLGFHAACLKMMQDFMSSLRLMSEDPSPLAPGKMPMFPLHIACAATLIRGWTDAFQNANTCHSRMEVPPMFDPVKQMWRFVSLAPGADPSALLHPRVVHTTWFLFNDKARVHNLMFGYPDPESASLEAYRVAVDFSIFVGLETRKRMQRQYLIKFARYVFLVINNARAEQAVMAGQNLVIPAKFILEFCDSHSTITNPNAIRGPIPAFMQSPRFEFFQQSMNQAGMAIAQGGLNGTIGAYLLQSITQWATCKRTSRAQPIKAPAVAPTSSVDQRAASGRVLRQTAGCSSIGVFDRSSDVFKFLYLQDNSMLEDNTLDLPRDLPLNAQQSTMPSPCGGNPLYAYVYVPMGNAPAHLHPEIVSESANTTDMATSSPARIEEDMAEEEVPCVESPHAHAGVETGASSTQTAEAESSSADDADPILAPDRAEHDLDCDDKAAVTDLNETVPDSDASINPGVPSPPAQPMQVLAFSAGADAARSKAWFPVGGASVVSIVTKIKQTDPTPSERAQMKPSGRR